MTEPRLLTEHGAALMAVATGYDADPHLIEELAAAGYLRRTGDGGFAVRPDVRVEIGGGHSITVGDLIGQGPSRRDEVTAILHDAVQTLAERGVSFAELTVDQLISETDLARSTFYTYFGDKAELLLALGSDVLEDVFSAASGWWEREEAPSKEDLRAALAEIAAAYVRHRVVMHAMAEMSASNTLVSNQLSFLARRSAQQVERHVTYGQREGFIDAELDPADAATWLNWMAEQGLNSLLAEASRAKREKLVDAWTDIHWNILYRSAA